MRGYDLETAEARRRQRTAATPVQAAAAAASHALPRSRLASAGACCRAVTAAAVA